MTLTPRLLLGFYTDPQGQAHVYKHDCVPTRQGQFEVGAARPGTAEDLNTLRGLLDVHSDALLHEHVLQHTATQSVWWVPAGPQLLFFRSQANAELNALSGRTFPQPPLLMIARRHILWVFALMENVRPTLDTPLFRAPYLNMFGEGQLCMGSVTLPATFNPADPHAHTQRFFESHFNGANTLTWRTGTHAQLWQSAAEQGHFPPDQLVPEPTIQTLASALAKGGRR
ncbi:hypothetical protein [Deinococcus multiflagellatus]|uniref:hypothetical protein n=1 Tax=Deinococcus multiflagellatus TaxID=1656887 RepID=UPI001CC93F40|nr:hypothetical protein [Deinococcus multiflagellatus]MBZ9714484.1 hypothetical protein [Deinococcus multiflagellatus]